MIRLIYASAATVPFDQAQLDALLETSRSNNQQSGLTGMLLYRDGDFLQVLEGEEDSVMATCKRIFADDRHSTIIELDRSDIDEREFGDWSMGFQRLKRDNTPEGFIGFFDRDFDETSLAQRGEEALLFLNHFKQISN